MDQPKVGDEYKDGTSLFTILKVGKKRIHIRYHSRSGDLFDGMYVTPETFRQYLGWGWYKKVEDKDV